MNRFNFKRQKISVHKVGVFKFWSGIVVGGSASIILSLFFNYGRETMRVFTALRADLLIIPNYAFEFYNYFFAALSTTLALCLCIAIWFNGNRHLSRRRQLFLRLSLTYALLISGMAIMFIVRLGSLFTLLPLGLIGYEDHLNLIKELGFILFLLPINIFLIAWFQTRLVYKTGRWIIYSIPICIFIIASLAKVTSIDRSLVNNLLYYNLHEEEFEYINQEIQKAEDLYQIEIKEEILHTLKKWQTESAHKLVSDLKQAIESNNAISMDSIILARIAVRTLKLDGKTDFDYESKQFRWDYPLPSAIYQQMKKFKPTSPEVYELTLLFREEIKLINSPVQYHSNSTETYTRKDYARSTFISNHLTKERYTEADSIRKVILSDSSLSIPDSLLPTLNQDYRRPTF